MEKFIQIFLYTILFLFALIICSFFVIPILLVFWPLLIIALPISLLIYMIRYIEEDKKKKNKKKIGFETKE